MLMNTNLPVKRKIRQEDFWIGLSDLMTSLMMIFLLISVIYMIKVQAMVKIPTIYKETLQGLGLALQKEFKNDLPKWKATIDNWKTALTTTINSIQTLITGHTTQIDSLNTVLDSTFIKLNLLDTTVVQSYYKEYSWRWISAGYKRGLILRSFLLNCKGSRLLILFITMVLFFPERIIFI